MSISTASGVDRVAALDPVFAQMASASLAHSRAVPELTAREQVFLFLVADVCQPSLGLPYELHVRAALKQGMSTEDIRALLRLISYDTGYPAALAALERLAAIESTIDAPDRPAAEPLPPALVSTGKDAAPSPLPEPIRAQLRELDPYFADYFDLQSRMRTPEGPGTLTIRERAFTTMSVDIHYQTLGDSFRIHVNRALGAGASAEEVRAVLRFNAQFGATRAWQAWHALNAILSEG